MIRNFYFNLKISSVIKANLLGNKELLNHLKRSDLGVRRSPDGRIYVLLFSSVGGRTEIAPENNVSPPLLSYELSAVSHETLPRKFWQIKCMNVSFDKLKKI